MIEPTVEAEDAWVKHVNDVVEDTLFRTAKSLYNGANIPGKPRVFIPYVGGFDIYMEKCEKIAMNGYEGFRLTKWSWSLPICQQTILILEVQLTNNIYLEIIKNCSRN